MENGAKFTRHNHFEGIGTHNGGQQNAKKQDQTFPFSLSYYRLPCHQE